MIMTAICENIWDIGEQKERINPYILFIMRDVDLNYQRHPSSSRGLSVVFSNQPAKV